MIARILSWLVLLSVIDIGAVAKAPDEPFAEKQKSSMRIEQVEALCRQYQFDHDMTGLAVAVIGNDGGQRFEHIATFGTVSRKSSVPITPYTEFRIGPLTQLFTASVLAYFVQSGQVRLRDPLSRFLSSSMVVPSYQGREISLENLATHTSGLPDIPYSLSGHTHFRLSQMYRFLSLYRLKYAPGSHYEYSYFGYAILANLLSRIGRRSFSELVEQIVLTPMNLRDTTFSLSPEQKSRYAIGYDHGRGISPLAMEKIYSTFIGAGGLYSTIRDMLTYLSFQLGDEQTSLNVLLPLMQYPYYRGKTFSSGLAWQIPCLSQKHLQILPKKVGNIFIPGRCEFRVESPFFDLKGSLFGFTSYMGIFPKKGVGVVLLSNKEEVKLDPLAEEILSLLVIEP
ncbi:MAG: serine hydrolase [Chlamydiota bacterium]